MRPYGTITGAVAASSVDFIGAYLDPSTTVPYAFVNSIVALLFFFICLQSKISLDIVAAVAKEKPVSDQVAGVWR